MPIFILKKHYLICNTPTPYYGILRLQVLILLKFYVFISRLLDFMSCVLSSLIQIQKITPITFLNSMNLQPI